MRLFDWLCAAEIPPVCDLTRAGWTRTRAAAAEDDCLALAHRACLRRDGWERLRRDYPRDRRARVILTGFDDPGERARLLGLGFGEVLGEPALAEVAARAARVTARARMLPAHRDIGALRLDLLARDGFIEGRRLALHPREFALIWRLAERPGAAIGKHRLIAEVWRLGHVPDTNSLAVHVFRLRAKLAAAGLRGLVLTDPEGGYLLAPLDARAIPLLTNDLRSDVLMHAEGVAIGESP